MIAAALLAAAAATAGFGSTHLLGQNAEHEQITRAALGCHPNNEAFAREGMCFQPRSLAEIAGTRGTFGAVAAPDNPANRELDRAEAHCDNGMILECRAYIDAALNEAVAAARALLISAPGDPARDGQIDDSEIPTRVACTFLRQKGRAKCEVIEHLGRALHAAQDFYSHTNWVDEAAPGAITVRSPAGLGRDDIAFLDVRHRAPPLPAGLISGCFIQKHPADLRGDENCTTTSHYDLNKDNGTIDPLRLGLAGDPTLTSARTPRGQVGRNFHRAVMLAVRDTRDKIRIFRERLVAAYGAEKGGRMFCAVVRDDPKTTCPGRGAGAAPAGCPEGFAWVGGHLCVAYNATKPFCDARGGRFVPPDIANAPARCELATR
jgi:hypothetical protein